MRPSVIRHAHDFESVLGSLPVATGIKPEPLSLSYTPHQDDIRHCHRKLGIQMCMLRHVPYARPGLFRPHTEHPYRAIRRMEQSQNEFEQRGFPAAVGTDHRHEIVFPDDEAHPLHDRLVIVREGEVLEFNDRLGCYCSSSRDMLMR